MSAAFVVCESTLYQPEGDRGAQRIQGDVGQGCIATGHGELMDFVGNPAHPRFYGDDNDRMPNFLDAEDENGEVVPGKLDEARVGLIVDWLRGEWPSAE